MLQFTNGRANNVECCQDRPGGYHGDVLVMWCTTCDNTSPPSNCSDRYCVNNCTAAHLLPPPASSVPTNALRPSDNNTGTPPGSIIKVPHALPLCLPLAVRLIMVLAHPEKPVSSVR